MDSNFLRSVTSLVPKPTPTSDYASSIMVRTLPLIGRVHIVHDISGMLQVGFVLAYWVYGTFSTLYIILLPHYHDGHIPYCLIVGYMFISVMCLLSLVKASITNPGRVPLASEEPGLATSEWTFCKTCMRKRPPRAHHCRRCQQCVMRMDHHCPWINNCVGEENHFSFFLLLFYACLLGASSFVLTMFHFWVWPKCLRCDQKVFYIKHGIWFLYVLVALALNMDFVMFCQLGTQHYNLLLDRTTLESMQPPQFAAADDSVPRRPQELSSLCGATHCKRPCITARSFWWCSDLTYLGHPNLTHATTSQGHRGAVPMNAAPDTCTLHNCGLPQFSQEANQCTTPKSLAPHQPPGGQADVFGGSDPEIRKWRSPSTTQTQVAKPGKPSDQA